MTMRYIPPGRPLGTHYMYLEPEYYGPPKPFYLENRYSWYYDTKLNKPYKLITYHCRKCKHKWDGVEPTADPNVRCPACRSLKNVEEDKESLEFKYRHYPTFECYRCCYRWTPKRTLNHRSRCPRCYCDIENIVGPL